MLSVTMLSSYLYCPRKLYLQYVLKITEPPKEVMVRGSVRHDTLDLINKNEQNIITQINPNTNIKALFTKQYSTFLQKAILQHQSQLKSFNLSLPETFKQIWPHINYEAEQKSLSIQSFITKHKLYNEQLWEKLTPKIISELKITHEKLQLRGIVDKVEVYPTGYVPIELKTGSMPKEGVWPGHKIQLGAYALLLEHHFNTEIKEGFVNYMDHKQSIQIPINSFIRIEVKDIIDKVNTLLNAKNPPKFCSNQNKCAKCQLKQQCYNLK